MYEAQTTSYDRVKFPTEIDGKFHLTSATTGVKKGEIFGVNNSLDTYYFGMNIVDTSCQKVFISLDDVEATEEEVWLNVIVSGEVDENFVNIRTGTTSANTTPYSTMKVSDSVKIPVVNKFATNKIVFKETI